MQIKHCLQAYSMFRWFVYLAGTVIRELTRENHTGEIVIRRAWSGRAWSGELGQGELGQG